MSPRAPRGTLDLDGVRSNGKPAAAAWGTLVLTAIFAVMSICAARPALAAAPDAGFQPNLERTVSYLQKAQNEDGGFSGEPGAESEPTLSAWVALALAATGINPRDQTTDAQHYAGGHSVYTYLAEHAGELSATTDFERDLLVVDAAGTSANEFGGVKLVEKILERQLPDGSFPKEMGSTEPAMNDTIFAILALSPIQEPVVQHAVQEAAKWVQAEQDCDHGWPGTGYRIVAACPAGGGELAGEPESEVDMTGAAIEALNAAGRRQAAKEVEQKAFQYLKQAQDLNGGFPEEPGPGNPEANVASTAWVVQAMWSAGINPETWLTHSGLATEEPLGYMASLQQQDGHIRFETRMEENGMWMTAYVAPAFAGDPLPIPAVPYEPLPLEPPDREGSGNGGGSPQPGGGVTAGGGGDGAPLFSGPQPDSKGHTPGGVRLLSSEHTEKGRTEHRSRGPARRTPVPTTTVPAPARSADDRGLGSGSASAGSGSGTTGARSASKGTARKAEGAGSASAGAGSDGAAAGRVLTATGTGDAQGPEREVEGVLIEALADTDRAAPLEPGAPGLRSAGAGDNETPWLAIGIGGAIVLLMLTGSQWERRRPQAIL